MKSLLVSVKNKYLLMNAEHVKMDSIWAQQRQNVFSQLLLIKSFLKTNSQEKS